MMRLGKAEHTLTRLSELDRKIIKDLALSRGCMTLREYTRVHDISIVGARKKIRKAPLDHIFKSIRLTGGLKAPEFFLLRSRYGRIYATNHKEPRSLKTILDALLRFQIQCEGGVWQHNLRHAGVMFFGNCAHIADCLDRSEPSVLRLANEIKTVKKVIHTLSLSRLNAFHSLLLRAGKVEPKSPTNKENLFTWEDLWNAKVTSNIDSPPVNISLIEINFHSLPITRTLKV
ncbi:MAG: hypothetical protein HYW48_02425 [Deltaproteobacteria bacterium]|nr:hypothetical protein [Deltaproteobacteria bacterium]